MSAAVMERPTVGSEGLQAAVVEITPAMAEAWLAGPRPPNRSIVASHVAFLAEQIRKGLWHLNGQPIILNEAGALIDGQNRLAAVLATGQSIKCMVVSGVGSQAFDSIDTGRVRAGRDVLSGRGVKNASHVATAASLLWRYWRSKGFNRDNKLKPSNAELISIVELNPELHESVRKVQRMSGMLGIGTSAFLHFVFSTKDAVFADAFFDALITGVGLRSGQPVYLLRMRLESNARGLTKLTEAHKIALTVKAWNAERTGQQLKVLKWSPDDEYPQAI